MSEEFKFSNESLVGYDLNVSVRAFSRVSAGVSLASMYNNPMILHKRTGAPAGGRHNLDSGHIRGLLFPIECGLLITSYNRLYVQGGIGRYSIDIPSFSFATPVGWTSARTTTITFYGTQETVGGYFLGLGNDFWVGQAGSLLFGARFDLKYHIVNTKLDATINQQLNFDGLRLGVGVIMAL